MQEVNLSATARRKPCLLTMDKSVNWALSFDQETDWFLVWGNDRDFVHSSRTSWTWFSITAFIFFSAEKSIESFIWFCHVRLQALWLDGKFGGRGTLEGSSQTRVPECRCEIIVVIVWSSSQTVMYREKCWQFHLILSCTSSRTLKQKLSKWHMCFCQRLLCFESTLKLQLDS